MKLVNPYESANGAWLKGALHVHSSNSDGADHPHDVFRDYAARGFDFVALTDHNVVPTPEDLDVDAQIVAIPGVEYRGQEDSELGILGVREMPPTNLDIHEYHDAAMRSGGFVTFNHPAWHMNHWPTEWMLKLGSAHALEVYNSVVDRLEGAAECADRWDCLLTCGYRIFGTATDDAHAPDQRAGAWVMVNAERNEESIIAALKAGRFYASSGVTVAAVRLDGNMLTVESENAEEIRFFADRGKMRQRADGRAASCEIHEDDIYLRAELYGVGASKAWTNPVFVESARSRELSDEFRAWYLDMPKRLARL